MATYLCPGQKAWFYNSGSGTFEEVAFPGATRDTDLIVVGVVVIGSRIVSSCQDSQSNTYQKAVDEPSHASVGNTEAWYAYNITGGASNTVRVNFDAAATYRGMTIEEWTGIKNDGNPLDKSAGDPDLSGIISSDVTPAENGEFIYGFAQGASGTAAADSPFTLANNTGTWFGDEWYVQATAAAIHSDFAGLTTNWSVLVCTFRPGPEAPAPPVALTYVGGVSGGRSGSTSTGLTLSLTALTGGIDTQPSTDDIVIIAVAVGSADRNVNIGVATPTDYTQTHDLYANDTYDANLTVSYKIQGATPDTSIVTDPSGNNADGLAAAVHVWRNIDLTTPFDVTDQEATGIDTGRPNPPAITPQTAGCVIICCGAGAATAGAAFTSSDLANMQSANGSDTNDGFAGIASKSGWVSGQFDPVQWLGGSNTTSDSWCAVTLVLRKVATGNTVNILASGPSSALGSATLGVLRGLKVSGLSTAMGVATSQVIKQMRSNGIATSYGATKSAVLRGMQASGAGVAYGSSRLARALSFSLVGGIAASYGSSQTTVFRRLRSNGFAASLGTAQSSAARGMRASGLSHSSASSRLARLAGIQASGLGVTFGAAQLGRLRALQASGTALGYGSSLITIVVGGVPIQMLASGLGMSIGVTQLAALRNLRASGLAAEMSTGKVSSILRGMKASGLGFTAGSSKTGVRRELKAAGLGISFGSSQVVMVAPGVVLMSASGLGLSISSAKAAALRGLKAEGLADGYGSALVTIFAGGGPKELLASGMGISLGLAKLGVIHLSCFPVTYACTSAGIVATTEVTGPLAGCVAVIDPARMLLDDALCIQGPATPPPPVVLPDHFLFIVPPPPNNVIVEEMTGNYVFNPLITIEAHDIDDNIVTEFTGDVTISLVTEVGNPSSLSGDLTVSAVDGVVDFPGVSINWALDPFFLFANYHLVASSPGVPDADSPTFGFGFPT